jgi:hypothetical protein
MSVPVIILGESGRGKSTSMRNLDPNKSILIQAIRKVLPFTNGKNWKLRNAENKEGSICITDKSTTVESILKSASEKYKIIIIDDFQYIMANEYMRRAEETGFNKFSEIGRNAWSILQTASMLPEDVRVYILWHEIQDERGNIKPKTIGKMLDEKITPEGMVSICLRAIKNDSGYFFQTQSSGFDPCKSPMGLFPENNIDNDLLMVDNLITDYFGLEK